MSVAANELKNNAAGPTARRNSLALVLVLVAVSAMAVVWWRYYALNRVQRFEVTHYRGELKVNGVPVDQRGYRAPADGASFETGTDGVAAVGLSDGSVLKLTPQTKLSITGARQNDDGRRFSTEMYLDIGEVIARVPSGDDISRDMSLVTKSVAIGVRGTVFWVSARGARSRLTVTEGVVEARATTGERVTVPMNFGTVIETGQAPAAPTALPSAPMLSAPSDVERVVIASPQFEWRSARGVARWQFELAQDPSFTRTMMYKESNRPELTLSALPRDGRYFWRVAAVDDAGLQGAWSTPRGVLHKYHLETGKVLLENGADAKAMTYFRAGEEGLADELFLLRRGGQESLLGFKPGYAKTQFEMFFELRPNRSPDDLPIRNALARAEYELLNYDAARLQYESVLAVDANDTAARLGLAVLDARAGDFAQALAGASAVTQDQPGNAEALEVAAMAAIGLGDRAGARQFIERALAADPRAPMARILKRSLEPADALRGALESVPRPH